MTEERQQFEDWEGPPSRPGISNAVTSRRGFDPMVGNETTVDADVAGPVHIFTFRIPETWVEA